MQVFSENQWGDLYMQRGDGFLEVVLAKYALLHMI